MVTLEIHEKFEYLFENWNYKVAYGGRGAMKTWTFADALLIIGAQQKKRILCAREFQNSIRESVHEVLTSQVERLGLQDDYTWTDQVITGSNGTEIIFAGIKTNPLKIKSMEGIDICWVEEAEAVSEASWDILIPTIRKPGSEIWISFNTGEESDPTYKRFVLNAPPGCKTVKVGYEDNPWLTEKMKQEAEYCRTVDFEKFQNIWGGEPKTHGDSKVLRGKCISTWFEPQDDWDGPYYGADWGFAADPTTLIKCWIHDCRLYVEKEVYGHHVELHDIPGRFAEIPECVNQCIRSDCSRPETISHVRGKGYPKLIGAAKWAGSVEDGIAFLRSFKEIVVHPNCPKTYEESKFWSFKTDRLTGDTLPVLVPGNDHCFVGETLITTIRGDVPIQDVNVGDLVLTRAGYKRVIEKFDNGVKEVKTYQFANGRSLTSTDTHKIITPSGKKFIRDITHSDKLYFLLHGEVTDTQESCVVQNHAPRDLRQVYDLAIEDQHEYFANGILVSNCWDAVRYALEPIIKSSKLGILKFYETMAAKAKDADKKPYFPGR